MFKSVLNLFSAERTIGIVVLTAVLFGCRSKMDDEKFILDSLEAGLIESSKVIQKNSAVVYESIENKTDDPSSSEIAEKYLIKADSVRKKTATMCLMITSVKQKLKEENSEKRRSELGDSFFNRIKQLYDELLITDTVFTSRYLRNDLQTPKSLAMEFGRFRGYFEDFSSNQISAILSKLTGDILIDENILLNRLHSAIWIPRRCVFVSPIIGMNSAVISVGDSVEITAGVGYFESMKRSKLIVDNVTVYPSENGLFVYKFKPNGKAGKKVIPVKIFYTDMDGNDVTSETKINVTVK